MINLTPQGPASYCCDNFPGLIPLLETHGYSAAPVKSNPEVARYLRGRSLLVLYRNGTVLLQGGDLEYPRTLFATLRISDQSELF